MGRRVLLPAVTALAVSIAALAVLPVGFSQGADSEQDYLDPHNAAREEVGVEPLTWDSTLADYAQGYADERAVDCATAHSHGPYGENLFWGSAGSALTAYDVVDSWVSEKQFYDYESNSCAPGKVCGHYTQVVWADTKRVGCGRGKCDHGRGDIIICSYDPPGNWEGEWPYGAIDAHKKLSIGNGVVN